MKYKLVASDLDGTLLDSSSRVGNRNLDAISKLTEKGVYFVPATGRTLCELPEEVLNCSDIRYVIHSNGATVTDRVSGEKIRLCIKKEAAKRLFDILYKYDAHLTVRHGGKSYAEKLFDNTERHNRIDKNHVAVISRYSEFPEDFKSVIYALPDVEVVSAYFHSDEERLKCRDEISALGECRAVVVSCGGLEIFDKSAGKGKALLALCEKLGIDASETIGVGDSGNDITLVGAAGLGLAVSNSSPSLTAEADRVICSCDEGAIGYILENYF